MLYPLSYRPERNVEQPGLEPGTHVVPSAFTTEITTNFGPPAATIGGETCLLLYPVELSYPRRARPGFEPGTHRLHVVPPAFAAGISVLATTIDERLPNPLLGPAAGFEPASVFDAYHVLPPAFASQILWKPTKKRPRRLIVTGYVVPASIRLPSKPFRKGPTRFLVETRHCWM